MVNIWTLSRDISLLKHMAALFPVTAAEWQLVADKLKEDGFSPSGRGAKERWLKTILPKFKSENTAALKRSGKFRLIQVYVFVGGLI